MGKIRNLNKKLLSTLLLTSMLSTGIAEQNILIGESQTQEIPIDFVENPIEEYYDGKATTDDAKKQKYNARQPWDLKEYNGKVYIATGDYDNDYKHKTVPLLYYDEEKKQFVKSGEYNEQAIFRMNEIDGKLVIPGIDSEDKVKGSKNGWELANYYTIDENHKFEKHRNIPNAPHVYDIVKHNNMLFAGIGNYNTSTPILVSYDNGETWNNTVIDHKNSRYTLERIYDLISFKGKLIAIGYPNSANCLVYEYNEKENKFEYNDSIKIPSVLYSVTGSGYLEKKVFNDKLCLVTPFGLIYTEDLINWTKVERLDNTKIMDIMIKDNELYVLANKKMTKEVGIVDTKETNLNVRTYPYQESESIEQLERGTKVNLTGNTYEKYGIKWIQVTTPKSRGWVNSKYVKIDTIVDYKVIVYKTKDLVNFNEEFMFRYPSIARSFEYSTDSKEFLFGIGSESSKDYNEHNGEIIKIGR